MDVQINSYSFVHSFIPFFLKFEMLLGRLEPDGKRKVRKYDHFLLVEKWQFTSLCKISFPLSSVNNYCSFCFVVAWLHWQVSQRYTKNNWACGQRLCREGSLWRGRQTLWSSQGTYIVYFCLYMYNYIPAWFPFSFMGLVLVSHNLHVCTWYYRIMKKHWWSWTSSWVR